MSFDPTKPCATRGSKYPVTILTVLPRPDTYGYTVYGTYIDDEDKINVEGWHLNGAYGPSAQTGSGLDLVNVPEPPKYATNSEYGVGVVKLLADGGQTPVASAVTHHDAEIIAAALNAYGR